MHLSLYSGRFRAIIAGNFAEIFFGNSINQFRVSLNQYNRQILADLIGPEVTVEIDLRFQNSSRDRVPIRYSRRSQGLS